MNSIKEIKEYISYVDGRLNKKRIAELEKNTKCLDIIQQEYGITDIRLAIILYENDLFEQPKCIVCKKSLNPYKRKFLTYCSRKCRSNSEIWKENREKSLLEKYGVTSTFASDEIIQKSKLTNIERYGFENAMSNGQIKRKAIHGKIVKHGAEVFHKQYEKYKETCLKKYGVENTYQSLEFKEKSKQTSMKKYGFPTYMQSPESKKKQSDYRLNESLDKRKNRNKKRKETYLSKKNSRILNIDEQEFFDLYFNKNYTLGMLAKKYNLFAGDVDYIFKFYKKDKENRFRSEGEIILAEKLRSKFQITMMENARNIVYPYELDIFFPENSIAVEYHGAFWHSSKYKNDSFHLKKLETCRENNIELMQFFDYELAEKEDIVISMIQSKLGLNETKFFARNLQIKEISSNSEYRKFVEENHIQGYVAASTKLGLYNNSELLMVMSFGKPRFNKQCDYELIRLCSKKYTTIVGGADRLFKYFLKTYNPQKIISYSDKRFSKGNVYEKLGFSYVNSSSPNYIYIGNSQRLSRYQTQKHKLKSLLGEENYDETLSETENMFRNNFLKVFDCGNDVWIYEYS